MLFTEVSNQDTFLNKSLIFFLNKKDLLAKKLPTHPLQLWQPDYQPPDSTDEDVNYNAATEFLKVLFLKQIDHDKRPLSTVYVHLTCALDTQNIEVVIKAVRTKLLQDLLQDIGISL
eukprot:TRINITY_DN2832_c0_g1_i1.p2 TRINITY_DN2832_c0_g1~~TRINITY_DN2832_c0_g1_i1.p2  ORF type:complete len:117 (+),score=14.15 TRINITY_DN2832_c0_g1_i1:705-1055(+)